MYLIDVVIELWSGSKHNETLLTYSPVGVSTEMRIVASTASMVEEPSQKV